MTSTRPTEGRVRLPLNCEAEFFPHFLSETESAELYDYLDAHCDLANRTVTVADGTVYEMDTGKHIYADAALTDFAHLHEVLGPRTAWPPLLLRVRDRLVDVLGRRFNVCLAIRYPDGRSEAGLHTDMAEFGPVSFWTVISLGAERDFLFRAKADGEELRVRLTRGSLLTMGEHCQERYEHGLPVDPACTEPRISLSYRPYGWD